jgi:citrate lyase gamma subunit
MMKMNAGIWIGIIGGIIGLLVGVGAVVTTGGQSGIYIGLGMLAVFGGMFYLFYRLLFKPIINANRLQKTGLSGTARILEVKDTGVTINNNPQVKLMLEVKNSFGQKYTTQCRVLVSRINPNAFMPGMEVPVKIDPKNEQNVVIDFSGSAKASTAASLSQPNEAALKSELEQMQKDNEALGLSGRPARAIIKKYTWLGAYVNGNNPYVELELEVLPENSSSFSGKAKGVIAEASVPKYQPGQEIFVKYDLYDNSKVVIDHS